MSSSSSADPMASLIRGALDTIALEHPAGSEKLLRAAGGLAVQIEVGDDSCGVRFSSGTVQVIDGGLDHADVTVSTDRPTVAEVLQGRLGLADALDRDLLRVVGQLPDVVTALDVLVLFVTVSVHAPAQQARFARFVATPPR